MGKNIWNEEGFDLTKEVRAFEEVVAEVKRIKQNAEKSTSGITVNFSTEREAKLDRLISLLSEQTYRDILLRRAGGLENEVVGYIVQEWGNERSHTLLPLEDYAELGRDALAMLEDERQGPYPTYYVDENGVASATKPDAKAEKKVCSDFTDILEDLRMEQEELK